MKGGSICRYFEKGNCKVGDRCQFVHRKERRAPCKFFAEGKCKFGEQCNFYHPPKEVKTQVEEEKPQEPVIKKIQQKSEEVELQQKKREINYARRILVSFTDLPKSVQGKENMHRINTEVYKMPYLDYIKGLTNPIRKEQARIMRRFQYSFQELSEDGSKFSLKLSPIVDNKEMKLNFDIPERCLQLVGQLSPINQLQIVNLSIPQYFKSELNEQIASKLKQENMYDVLKYLENKFESLCQQVDFILENKSFTQNDLKHENEETGIEIESDDQPEKVEKKAPQQIKQKTVEQLEKLVEEERKEETKEEEAKQQDEPKQKQIIPEIQLNYVLQVQTLETNCQSMLIENVLIHLVCSCTSKISYIVKAKGKKSLTLMSKIKCTKCHEPIIIYTRRRIVLRNSVRLAEMGAINARLEEVGAIQWKVNCQCESVIQSQQLSLSGVKTIIKCFDCFQQYFIQYFGVFVETYEKPQERARPKMEKMKEQNGPKFKLDTELPEKGCCKHYKLSFRWLRFNCCGRAFPCDKCHEENTAKHDYDRADVMICGLCSFQQPAEPICRRCKKELVKGTEKSGHWEGGKGCRDQTLLSRKDPKKFTGLSKTQANKK